MEVLKRRSTWAWTIRIAVSAMFVVSGLAKLFPITPFEKQLFDLLGGSFCTAQYLARLIVALEFAIAVGILQRHFLKRYLFLKTTRQRFRFEWCLTSQFSTFQAFATTERNLAHEWAKVHGRGSHDAGARADRQCG